MRRCNVLIFMCLVTMACILPESLHAQVSFTATVNKNKVSVNERFQFIITLNNGSNPENFRPPSFTDFTVLGGPNQSTSVQMFNNTVQQSMSFSYILQPKKTGKFQIGAAYIKVKDKTYSSQPIVIEVTDAPPATAGAQNNNSGSNNGSSGSASGDIEQYLRENLLIKTEISDQDVYEGESFTVVLKLCIPDDGTIAGLNGYRITKTPAYDGFYVEDADLRNEQFKAENINGKNYKTVIIKKTTLTPQQSGNLVIDPTSLDAGVVVRVKKQKKNSGDPFQDMLNDFFSDPFSSGSREFTASLSSKTTGIKIKPLPANAPADFNGAVGKFTMSSQINSTSTKTDEPLTYRITINGTGNLQLFNAPELDLPAGWETYDPKVSESSGTKIFEYLLIPRSPGDFTIPAFTWSYFDPSVKKYQTLQTDAYPVKVTAGRGYNPSANNYAANKEDVELLGKDIRYIDKDSPKFSSGTKDMKSGFLLALILTPAIGGAGLFVFTRRQKAKMSDVGAMRAVKANATAKKRLAAAGKFLQQNNSRGFYDETVRALWGYLSDKLHIPQNALSKENIEQVLLNKHVSASTIDQFIQLLDTCEFSLYAPNIQHSDLELTFNSASSLISTLENELR